MEWKIHKTSKIKQVAKAMLMQEKCFLNYLVRKYLVNVSQTFSFRPRPTLYCIIIIFLGLAKVDLVYVGSNVSFWVTPKVFTSCLGMLHEIWGTWCMFNPRWFEMDWHIGDGL